MKTVWRCGAERSAVFYQSPAQRLGEQVPGALRGYVQIAINNGGFEAFPAQVIQNGNGTFTVLPGPRFEPNTGIVRSIPASKLNRFRQLFTTGG